MLPWLFGSYDNNADEASDQPQPQQQQQQQQQSATNTSGSAPVIAAAADLLLRAPPSLHEELGSRDVSVSQPDSQCLLLTPGLGHPALSVRACPVWNSHRQEVLRYVLSIKTMARGLEEGTDSLLAALRARGVECYLSPSRARLTFRVEKDTQNPCEKLQLTWAVEPRQLQDEATGLCVWILQFSSEVGTVHIPMPPMGAPAATGFSRVDLL